MDRSEPTTAESTQEQPTDDGASGAWRRRLVGAGAVLAAGMYLRRRRSSPETQQPAEAAAAEGKRDRTAGRSGPARMIGRRLKMLLVSTVVFALARRVVRRFRSNR